MEWFKILITRLRALVRRDAVIDDIEEEMRSHIEWETQTNIERGMKPHEARQAALRSFGHWGRIRELAYDIRGGGIMDTLRQDLRYGWRALQKQPGFALIAVITLALGIGANTAIFSIINAVLLKPLPYAESERLVKVFGNFVALNATNMRLSVPEYVDFQQQTRSFEASGVFDSGSANLSPHEGGEPERVERGWLTPGLFAALKVAPVLGRAFTPEDGRDDVVLLSHGLWQRRYAGKADVIGQKLDINGHSHTIIGVMPPGFAFPQKVEIWKALWFPKEQYDQQRRGSRGLEVLARLKPTVSLTEAQAELDRLSAQFTEQYPQNYRAERRYRMTIVPMLENTIGEVKSGLLILLGAVGFVLLIACANVANLLLARAATRRQEMAVRLALGAGRGRLVRQLLTESVLLAVMGGIAGWLLAAWCVRLLLRFAPDNLPRLGEVNLDGRVLAFTALASLLTGIVFGLAPALQAARADVNEALREGGRGGASAQQQRLRHAFVVAEIALALVLLTGAGLTLKSFWHLQAVDPGFKPDGVLTARLLLPFETYPQAPQRAAFYRQVVERIKAVPGVAEVGLVSRIPMVPGNNSGVMTGEHSAVGPPRNPNDPPGETEMRWATPDYFQALGINMLNGRPFKDADVEGTEPVVIVDDSFARRFYPNENPIGKRIKRGNFNSTSPWHTIVGVVRQVRNQRLDSTSLPQAYFSIYQDPTAMFNMSLAIRAIAGDPASLTQSVRAAVLRVDRNQPVYDVKTLRQIVADSIALRRLALMLLSVFAVVAVVLSAVGIYGVMAYSVAQRTHEIGIRMALGARESDVLRLVLRQGLALTGVGIGLGWLAALGLTRLIESLLFGVSPTDSLTFGSVAALLVGVALAACYLPARRAAKVDPMVALRYE